MKRLVVILVIVGVSACGGKDSPTSPSNNIPAPQVFNYSPVVLGPGFYQQDITIFQNPANIRATLTWTDSRKDLDLYWTNALCAFDANSGQLVGSGCVILLQSTSSVGTSEQVAGPTPAASTVRLFVFNFSNTPEPIQLTVNATFF